MKKDIAKQLTAKELFLEVVALSCPAERDALLTAQCNGDPELRMKVDRLLAIAEHEAATNRLDVILGAFGIESTRAEPQGMVEDEAATKSNPQPLSLRDIGPYKLLEQIGEGAFGTVYMAAQTTPVRRKVALKVLRPGMDSGEVIARFEAERQALAMMEHPNIAKVLDGGTDSDGRPYFVMELVRGVPVTEYCDELRLTTNQRLTIFLDICRAVQHAHQKGIIHRDLKPSNVLVTMHDDKGVPKIIDFGIAKALNQPLTERTLFTGFHQMLGTPLYMSPEQAQMSGNDIDTRSDIYSLGVLLYELLTGTTPFSRESLSKLGFDDLRRIICEQEPPRPSVRVTTMEVQARTTVADRRRIDARRISHQLRGELDWIVMKALEKQRERRYESAGAFLADVERYLKNEPVEACPPSWKYRLGKTLHKYRVGIAMLSILLASLLVGLGLTLWQWQRALTAEADTKDALVLAAKRGELAQRRLGIAEEAIDVMYTQFAEEWLKEQAGMSDVQRQFLERAVAAYTELSSIEEGETTPRIGAVRALLRLASININLGNSEQALDDGERALHQAKVALEQLPNELEYQILAAQSAGALAYLYRERSDNVRAIDYADQMYFLLLKIDERTDLSEQHRKQLTIALSHCTRFFSVQSSRKREAADSADRAVSIARELVQEFPNNLFHKERLADALSSKGQQTLWWGSDNETCLAAYQESLQLKKEILAESPNRTFIAFSISGTIQNLIVVLERLQRSEEAEALNKERVAFLRDLVQRFPDLPNLQSQLGVALHSVGLAEHRRGNSTARDEIWLECEAVHTKVLERFPQLKTSRNDLLFLFQRIANIQLDSGELELAHKTCTKAMKFLSRFEELFPGDANMYVLQTNFLKKLSLIKLGQAKVDSAGEYANRSIRSHESGMAARRTTDTKNLPYYYFFPEVSCYFWGMVLLDLCEMQTRELGLEDSLEESLARWNPQRAQWTERARELVQRWEQYRPDSATEWGELSTRIDQKENWKFHGSVPSVADMKPEVIAKHADLRTRVFLFGEYLQHLAGHEALPAHWPDTVIAAASSNSYSSEPELILQLCERGRIETPDAMAATRAHGWALFRCKQYQECHDILAPTGTYSDEDGFILSMASYQLGEHERAVEQYGAADKYLELNREQLETRRSAKPAPIQPNIETLLRLKSEAAKLLNIDK